MNRRAVIYSAETANVIDNSGQQTNQNSYAIPNAYGAFPAQMAVIAGATRISECWFESDISWHGNPDNDPTYGPVRLIDRNGQDIGNAFAQDDGQVIAHMPWLAKEPVREGQYGIVQFAPQYANCQEGQAPPICHTGWIITHAECDEGPPPEECEACFYQDTIEVPRASAACVCIGDRAGLLPPIIEPGNTPTFGPIRITASAKITFSGVGPPTDNRHAALVLATPTSNAFPEQSPSRIVLSIFDSIGAFKITYSAIRNGEIVRFLENDIAYEPGAVLEVVFEQFGGGGTFFQTYSYYNGVLRMVDTGEITWYNPFWTCAGVSETADLTATFADWTTTVEDCVESPVMIEPGTVEV